MYRHIIIPQFYNAHLEAIVFGRMRCHLSTYSRRLCTKTHCDKRGNGSVQCGRALCLVTQSSLGARLWNVPYTVIYYYKIKSSGTGGCETSCTSVNDGGSPVPSNRYSKKSPYQSRVRFKSAALPRALKTGVARLLPVYYSTGTVRAMVYSHLCFVIPQQSKRVLIRKRNKWANREKRYWQNAGSVCARTIRRQYALVYTHTNTRHTQLTTLVRWPLVLYSRNVNSHNALPRAPSLSSFRKRRRRTHAPEHARAPSQKHT